MKRKRGPRGPYKLTPEHRAISMANLKLAHAKQKEQKERKAQAAPDDDAAAMQAAAASAAQVAVDQDAAKPPQRPSGVASRPGVPALADLMNGLADMVARTPPGTAEACKVGQSWVAVMEYYFPNVGVNHPVIAAVWATGQFGAAAWVTHGLRKSAEKQKKDAPAAHHNNVTGKTLKPGDNLFDNVPT